MAKTKTKLTGHLIISLRTHRRLKKLARSRGVRLNVIGAQAVEEFLAKQPPAKEFLDKENR